MEEEELGGDDVARSVSSLRMSIGSGSRRSWASVWSGGEGSIFRQSRRKDEDELMWAAMERLPTYDRLRKGILKQVLDSGRFNYEEVDIANLGMQEKKQLMGSILRTAEEDNEKFLCRLRDRIDRVGIEIPKIEVRFEHLSVEGDAYIGTRALPTLVNSVKNVLEVFS